MNDWFIPYPEEFPSQRALLHLGLNRALRYYRELVVPGIGGVWFVRQISWAVAGIAIAKKLHLKPAKIANAIEALACKLEWYNVDEYSGRGTRAFNRDGDTIWSFKELSDKKHYVQIPYRQSTVRALTGLSLAIGTRFNQMALTQTGIDLSEVFFGVNPRGNIKKALVEWIKDNSEIKPRSVIKRISKSKKNLTRDEIQIVRDCLLSDSSDKIGNSKRRRLLIESFSRYTVNMPEMDVIIENLNQHQDQVDDIETAIAFDAMLECGQQIIHQCAKLVADNGMLSISEATKSKKVNDLLKKLRLEVDSFNNKKGGKHYDAFSFAESVSNENNKELIINIINRDGNILSLSNEKIVKGSLFDHRREITDDVSDMEDQSDSEGSSTEIKILQLFSLWRDCQ